MLLSSLKRLVNRIRYPISKYPDNFLLDVTGVIHVGANTGQERDLYAQLGLRVLWIEPIPAIFETLQANIQGYPNQRAVQALVTDRDDQEYPFHISNYDGQSSSILQMHELNEIWPDVHPTSTILLRSVTLSTLLKREQLNLADYQALVMDTEGSELLVLQGCQDLLRGFKFIKTETADFEPYVGCSQLQDMNAFMAKHGFAEMLRKNYTGRSDRGNYYNMLYRRVD